MPSYRNRENSKSVKNGRDGRKDENGNNKEMLPDLIGEPYGIIDHDDELTECDIA
jgi:hypothetical protein